jgi:hypothetical protein
MPRSLLECISFVRRTACRPRSTTGVLVALLAGIAVKLRLFGSDP